MTDIQNTEQSRARRDAESFAFYLLVNDMRPRDFFALPMQQQIEFGEGVARLEPERLFAVLRFLSNYHAEHAAQLQAYVRKSAEARREQAN